MATCPRCGSRDRLTLDTTGESLIVAVPVGTFSLAGGARKFTAHEMAELELVCEKCGWAVKGYIDGGHLVELPPGQTPETAAMMHESGSVVDPQE